MNKAQNPNFNPSLRLYLMSNANIYGFQINNNNKEYIIIMNRL